jgi:hypothetical protein
MSIEGEKKWGQKKKDEIGKIKGKEVSENEIN